MKNKEILEEGKEALNRTLLMMNYDMKKTLTENVEVLSEQTTTEKDIKDDRPTDFRTKQLQAHFWGQFCTR